MKFTYKNLFSFSFVPLREKVAFARNVGAMLSAGLPLSRALEVLVRQSGNKSFKKTLSAIGDEVRKGRALSDALRQFPRVFPPLFPAVVAAGEESGSLAQSFASLAEQLDRVYALGRKLRGALIYPAIIILVMIAIAILMLIYVVPELSSTFKEFGVALPLSTRALVYASDALQNHSVLFLSSVLFVAAVLLIFFRTAFGGRVLDFCALHTPELREIVVELNSARTARTLGSLTSAGVPIVASLGVVADVVQNSYYHKVIMNARAVVEKGKTLSSAFAEAGKLYQPYFSEMVASGEETGKLGEMLKETALFYEAEVEQKTKNLSAVVEPVLMVAVGIAAGFFAYSMILPMYTLMNNV
ncbi:MAG: type II secretion system F family protein [bacterium]|nr:type II secretion system F family protein [bacterium]